MKIWRTAQPIVFVLPVLLAAWLLVGAGLAEAGSLPVLRQGNRGGAVLEAQRVLSLVGTSPGPRDGIFGPRTQRAVRMFQRNHSLVADGVIGPRTWQALYRAEAKVAGANRAGARGSYHWPTRLRRVSSPFGPRSAPCGGCSRVHQGVDFPGPIGEPVQAARSGRVRFAGWAPGYGRVVYVDHDGGHQTRYAHLNAIWVGRGQQVRSGQTIGTLGESGLGTGAHLHFELRVGGRAVNPLPYLRRW